ncbi:hypothetical protein [Streptomyces sp. NPDC006012]|uniref:hypothetical protein n=1 Tax=Streptomyces sp. NPDC006012 TaxID=3364739 RepID=UPI0036A964B3
MAYGTGRPIEQIKTGNRVTATDPAAGKTGPRHVTRTVHHLRPPQFSDVTLADGSTLTSTSHHPYWSENDHTWSRTRRRIRTEDFKSSETVVTL